MIKINGIIITPEYYPDGTQKLLLPLDLLKKQYEVFNSKLLTLYWRYEKDEELITLIYLTKHIRNEDKDRQINLYMPYVPNGRMDRVKTDDEVFTLKYFCDIINSLEFNNIYTIDPHSSVTNGLINHYHTIDDKLDMNIQYAICHTKCNLIYFPDAGALKRYGDLPSLKDYPKVYGKKNRDWKTGDIKGLTILSDDGDVNELINNADILMIDDIISYGGTLYYGALELKKFGANQINAYATHTENSVLDENKGKLIKLLNDGTVSKIYTTDSIFTKEYSKIEII